MAAVDADGSVWTAQRRDPDGPAGPHRWRAVTALEDRVLAAAAALDPGVEVLRIDPAYADTVAFCERYGYRPEDSCNCIVVVAKTGERRHAACLVQATRRLDLNRRSRELVGARKASFASEEDTREVTGMVPGGVTPVGLPPGLPLFVDEPIMRLDRIIVGGGGRALKLLIDPRAVASQPHVVVASISVSV